MGTLTGVSPFSPSATIRDTTRDSAQNSTNKSVIKETVDQTKAIASFPLVVDKVTTLTNITAETNAIRPLSQPPLNYNQFSGQSADFITKKVALATISPQKSPAHS